MEPMSDMGPSEYPSSSSKHVECRGLHRMPFLSGILKLELHWSLLGSLVIKNTLLGPIQVFSGAEICILNKFPQRC